MPAGPPVALTIAGSDPSGGAGIQADLKTFHQHRVYGAAVVSLLTVQNTVSVSQVSVQSGEFVAAQLRAVLSDLPVAACKTGALGEAPVVEAVAAALHGRNLPLVVDPVTLSKHGARLLQDAARETLRRALLPLCTLVTPNLAEAAELSGRPVAPNGAGAADAARAIADLGPRAVLVKGGHRSGPPMDLLWFDGVLHELPGERVHTQHTHGLGCTLSAAITARLAQGVEVPEACAGAKAWLTRAIASAPGLGAGQGAVDHLQHVD